MISFTLKNLKRDSKQDDLYNIFKQTYIDKNNLPIYETYVNKSEEMRLDKVSYRIYGSTSYIEELMIMNNIINILNIKQGDVIYYAPIGGLDKLKELEKEIDDTIENISKPNKNTRIDENRSKNVPPTIKPKSLKTLTLDTKNKKIKIHGKLS